MQNILEGVSFMMSTIVPFGGLGWSPPVVKVVSILCLGWFAICYLAIPWKIGPNLLHPALLMRDEHAFLLLLRVCLSVGDALQLSSLAFACISLLAWALKFCLLPSILVLIWDITFYTCISVIYCTGYSVGAFRQVHIQMCKHILLYSRRYLYQFLLIVQTFVFGILYSASCACICIS